MRIRGLVDEVLEEISRLLILGLVTGAVQGQSGAQICVRVVRACGQNLLILSEGLVAGACVEKHLRHVELSS